MKTKSKISLSLMCFALCSVAIATEYKSPTVGFKKYAVPSKEMKVSEFGDHYKVETETVNTDRQIASEEESDREPSSFVPEEKKSYDYDKEVKKDFADAPKPWLYRNEARRN